MLGPGMLHAPICTACRLRAAITAKQLARCRKSTSFQRHRAEGIAAFGAATRQLQQGDVARDRHQQQGRDVESFEDAEAQEEGRQYANSLLKDGIGKQSPEEAALTARETYGARLPDDVLDDEAYKVYERLYGKPLEAEEEAIDLDEAEVSDEEEGGVVLLKEGSDGELEEVEVAQADDEDIDGLIDGDDVGIDEDLQGDDARLSRDIESALATLPELDVVSSDAEDAEAHERAHPLTAANRFGTSPSTLALPSHSVVEPVTAQLTNTNNKHLAAAAHRTLGGIGLPYGPATPARLKTMQQKPIQIDAYQHSVSGIDGDVFLAAILPAVYASVMSVLTETRKRLGTAWAEDLVRKAEKGELRILDAGGAGAGVLAVRELLRAEWERMIEERLGGLDSSMALAEAAGQTGGEGASPPLGTATVVAGSDVLRHRAAKLLENTTIIPRLPDYVHTAEQKAKGKFDVVIAPHTLWGGFRFDRERKVHVQNLWSLLDANGGVLCLLEKGVSRGFEVVAGAREMLLRTRIRSSGSKGTEFDEDAEDGEGIVWDGAVEEAEEAEITEPPSAAATLKNEPPLIWEKEKGTIVAPCTNHAACPMYRPRGFLKGRRDVCAFEQRYVRPPFLQHILGAKDKNFEDVEFSYLSVMRGRDLLEEKAVVQDQDATEAAFVGYEASTDPGAIGSLSLPRQVLPPLKKKGHVLLDLCTSASTLERWTVPRSFSKRAFRDARKSGWGDLWALGAKTRVARGPRMNEKHGGRLTKEQRAEVRGMMDAEGDGREITGTTGGKRRDRRAERGDGRGRGVTVDIPSAAKSEGAATGTVLDTDEYGRIVVKAAPAEDATSGGRKVLKQTRVEGGRKHVDGAKRGGSSGEGGRMRTGQKVGGLRDKRDKSGRGNGRRRSSREAE